MAHYLSWRTVALVLALINLKNLPFSWHVRLFYYFVRNLRLRPHWALFPRGRAITDAKGRPTHPVFVPCSIWSRTPPMEMDYNLHKSNSTYFSDLDVARTAIVTRLYSPGMGIVSRLLDQQLQDAPSDVSSSHEGSSSDGAKSSRGKKSKSKKKHPIYVALGSVYCTFKREIKPLEPYEIQTRVIAWDEKWLYTLSFFLRPAKRKGDEKTLLASAISKYVVKKGRLTVPPERVLRLSGFLPERPEGTATAAALAQSLREESTDTSAIGTPASVEGITATTSGANGVDGSLVREVLKLSAEQIPPRAELDAKRESHAGSWDAGVWTWDRIEEERQRGLKVVENYTTLDAKLYEEWKR